MTDKDTGNTDDSMTVDSLRTIKGRKFIFLNARSILPNINLIRADFEHSDFLLIGNSETWLTKRIHDDLIKIQGFNLVRYDRKQPKRGGGILFYINDAVDYQIPPANDMCLSDADLEVLTIIVKLPNQLDFVVSLVYIPPTADKSAALSKLKSTFELNTSHKFIRIVAGDFNMDYSGRNKRSSEKSLLLDFERSTNLAQIIKTPTRVTNKTASLIDLIFVPRSIRDKIPFSSTMAYNISDHDMTFLVYKKEAIHKPKVTFTFRDLKNYN